MTLPESKPAGPIKVVAAYVDGTRLKGFVFNFSPLSDQCRFFPSERAVPGEAREVHLLEVKALFFVKEFSNPALHDKTHSHEFVGAAHGRRIEVIFADGELVTGTTEGYNPRRLGFFVTPANQEGNNLRIFVVNANVSKVRWL